MLRPRLIPCLLIQNNGLVKTVEFKSPKYVGDPVNAVRIFNEKLADELMVIDIDASSHGKEPNYERIKNLANESRMPLCYGGGIKTVTQIEKIISLGVEKVAISSAVIENKGIIKEASDSVGSQSIVVVLDIKKKGFFNNFHIYTHNGSKQSSLDLMSFIEEIQHLGAGELVINFIDNDGKMEGYNIDTVKKILKITKIPLTILGGAGSEDDIHELWSKAGFVGASAGSLFVFKGKFRAVLINYPDPLEKENILEGISFN